MDGSNLSPKGQITRTTSAAVTAQKKLIAVLIFVWLAVLLLLIIMLVNTAQKSNIASQITSSTKPKEPNVNLKKAYENPFSTRTQYVNPFSDYKNPFDNLNEN